MRSRPDPEIDPKPESAADRIALASRHGDHLNATLRGFRNRTMKPNGSSIVLFSDSYCLQIKSREICNRLQLLRGGITSSCFDYQRIYLLIGTHNIFIMICFSI